MPFASSLFLSGCRSGRSNSSAVRFGVSGYSADVYRKLLDELCFTDKTGIEVEVVVRPNSINELLTQMSNSVQAKTSPYDLLDFEDSVAMSLSRAGWLCSLDDLVSQQIWDDYTLPLQEMTKIWDQYKGETFRIHYNFELCYWWYRKDWFDQKQAAIPRTWDDMNEMRQRPFFYDVVRLHENWFTAEKATCGLPPVGPGGEEFSTYACG